MEVNKESSFVREVENRLNVLFGEDVKNPDQKDKQPKMHESLKDIAADANVSGGGPLDKMEDLDIDGVPDKPKGSPFIQEIEQRLNLLFGEDAEPAGAEAVPEEHESLKGIMPEIDTPAAKEEKGKRFDRIYGEMATSTSILYSPLKDLKSIVLSIEWEINDSIMIKFDEELNRLHDLLADDRMTPGFLRILRFLGRYVRVRGSAADAGSINLLLSVYDDLESVVLSRDLTVEKRQALLLEDIRKYRYWVDKVDLAVQKDEPQLAAEEVQKPVEPEKQAAYWAEEGEGDYVIAEPIILSKKQSVMEAAVPQAERGNEEAVPAVSGEMTPHEAFDIALEEIKKTIHAEFSALRAELKMWRQGQ
ncbi:MAG: hypothetical protein NTV58_05055 [Deltaproteobacteria bacterium]|nr:hypothetical protein [Deltaproteobacteria bacterium]